MDCLRKPHHRARQVSNPYPRVKRANIKGEVMNCRASITPGFAGPWIWLSIALFVALSGAPFGIVAAQNQESDFEPEFAAGKLAAGRGDYTEAAKHFVKANELRQGKCSECYVWMARMDIGLGVFSQAVTLTDKAITVAVGAHELAKAQLYRGVALGREGNLSEAEAAFREALAADPTCVECKFNLGFVLLKQSKDTEGIAVLKMVASAFAGTSRGDEIERFIKDPSRINKNYAPEFSAKSLTGEDVNLNTLKGKVVLLEFWGTWCTACRVSLPQLKDLASKIDSGKVAIVSVDEYDPKPTWEKYVHENGMNWVQIFDGDLSLHNAFGVDGFPRYYIL